MVGSMPALGQPRVEEACPRMSGRGILSWLMPQKEGAIWEQGSLSGDSDHRPPLLPHPWARALSPLRGALTRGAGAV